MTPDVKIVDCYTVIACKVEVVNHELLGLES